MSSFTYHQFGQSLLHRCVGEATYRWASNYDLNPVFIEYYSEETEDGNPALVLVYNGRSVWIVYQVEDGSLQVKWGGRERSHSSIHSSIRFALYQLAEANKNAPQKN